MTRLNQRVREARKLANLSQEELAAALGVSRGAVAQWEMENGTSPAMDNMAALARRSGMCIEYLATGRGPKVFGAPVIEEERGQYSAVSDEQSKILFAFAKLSPRKRAALLELLKPGD